MLYGSSTGFNEDTQQSSWTDPHERAKSRANTDDGSALADKTGGGAHHYHSEHHGHHVLEDHPGRDASAAARGARSDGWEQVTKDGTAYWWNSRTSETRWDAPPDEEKKPAAATKKAEPASTEQQQQQQQSEEDDAGGGLPDGWTSFMDENYGQRYYVNSNTGATSWTKPTV